MTNPSDGRMTSLDRFTGTLPATAIMEVVTPGSAAQGVNYQIQVTDLANALDMAITSPGGTVRGNPSGTTAVVVATTSPVLGIASTSFGTLGLASGTSGGAIVTLGNPLATAAYSFNLPAVPGTVGALLVSGGGASTAPNNWSNLGSILSATSGLAVSGSTTPSVALATQTGLSVLGVAGAATAIPAAIRGTSGQLLGINAGGTALAFTTISLSVPTPWSISTVTAFGVVYGMGTAAVSATLAGTAGLVLFGTGTATAPEFQQINLASAATLTGVLPSINITAINLATSAVGGVTGTLGVPFGGSAGTTFAQFGLLVGNSTARYSTISGGTTGWPLVAQGTAALAAYTTLGVAGGGSGGTTFAAFGLLAGNTAAAYSSIAAGTTGWPLVAQGAAALAAYTTLGFVGGGTNATTALQALANMTGASLLATAQILTGGFRPTAFNLGSITSATTVTLDPGNGPLQRLVASAAFSVAAPSFDGEIDLLVTNGAGASTITIVNYTAANTGATYTTTNARNFIFQSRTINASSTYQWVGYIP